MVPSRVTPSIHGTSDCERNSSLLPIKMNATAKKVHPVWKYFAALCPRHEEYSRNKFICLLCREVGVNKVVKVGMKSPSPTPLLNHVRVLHPESSHNLLVAKEAKRQVAVQASITDHLPVKVDARAMFRRNYIRWIVEESKPFSIGSSDSFQSMVLCLNPKVTVPDKNEVLRELDLKKLQTKEKVKSLIKDGNYSLTTDHWTSISNDNYGALTLHFIDDDFKLRAFILSFEKHVGGCSGEELQQQLYDALSSFPLPFNNLSAIVTDSAANMNRYGESIMRDHPALHHHYCVDHVLHLTALKCFSTDSFLDSLKALKSLVTFINSSPQSNDKLFEAQKRVNPSRKPLKLLTDVKTRWWSTHVMIERAVRLRPALETMFRLERLSRQQSGKATPSKLEQLELTDCHFRSLQFLDQVLSPFREAQRALEGDKYVNLSLVVLILKKLYQALTAMLADSHDSHPELFPLISLMVDDFEQRWGNPITYSSVVTRGAFNRQEGIPPYAYWAAVLDPRTKKPTLKLLSQQEKRNIWKDIHSAILHVAAVPVNNDINLPRVRNVVDEGAVRVRRGAALFLTPEDEAEGDDGEDALTLEARVSTELALYEASIGCPLHDQHGFYHCPLLWWKNNYLMYPNVWLLARKILCIPATSAPSERVFSLASNVIDKKRARLTPTNANVLLFLRGNREIVDWSI